MDLSPNVHRVCGIAGILSANPVSDILEQMLATLRHRGPDDAGIVTGPGIALGHRRLSVIDLSPAGRQPMSSGCGRCHLTYNGEIYNFEELRKELYEDGYSSVFEGYSDTEVLLACLVHWGVPRTLERLVGMFAFAFWDGRQLWLVRDRIGQKPLYYGWCGRDFVFASELRAFRCHPEFDANIDRQALELYLCLGYVPNPYSIFSGISKLQPGHYYVDGKVTGYWSHPVGTVQPMSDEEARHRIGETLRNAVTCRLVADVPLGVLLSGGIDSSLVAALAQEESGKPIRTFALGFDSPEFDESQHAARVADYLRTEHTEIILSPEAARDHLACFNEIHDEPFCDPSRIPTYLVCREARKFVTVALSGDDGDSQFMGYPRYNLCHSQWKQWGRLPRAVRHLLSGLIEQLPPRLLQVLGSFTFREFGDRARGLQELLRCDSLMENYLRLAGFWPRPAQALRDGPTSPTRFVEKLACGASPLESLMFWDTQALLPDGILTKVERAGMANSLEVRSPLLDHRLWELSWGLPLRMKYRDGTYKWILRELLYEKVPREIVDRPKQGFCIPLADWLRGPFREWAYDYLSPEAIRGQGFFDPRVVRETWHEFQNLGFGWQDRVWSLAIFGQWWESYR